MPFNMDMEYPQPNKESLESLKETNELVRSEHPGYDSLDAMLDSMEL